MKIVQKVKNIIDLLNKENSSTVYGLSVLIFLTGIALGSFSPIFKEYGLNGRDFPLHIVVFPVVLSLSSLFTENLLLAITSLGLYLYPLILLIGCVENNNPKKDGSRIFSFVLAVVFSCVLVMVFLGFFKEFIDDYQTKKIIGYLPSLCVFFYPIFTYYPANL